MPRIVAALIPKNIVVPTATRLFAPAPVANSIGITPKTHVNAVMRTARKRSLAQWPRLYERKPMILSLFFCEFDYKDRVLRCESDEQQYAKLCIDTQRQSHYVHSEESAERCDRQESMTGTGTVQLSYCATRKR